MRPSRDLSTYIARLVYILHLELLDQTKGQWESVHGSREYGACCLQLLCIYQLLCRELQLSRDRLRRLSGELLGLILALPFKKNRLHNYHHAIRKCSPVSTSSGRRHSSKIQRPSETKVTLRRVSRPQVPVGGFIFIFIFCVFLLLIPGSLTRKVSLGNNAKSSKAKVAQTSGGKEGFTWMEMT